MATIAVIVLFGAWTAWDAFLREAHVPTPWMGIKERVNVYSTMLWMLVFSFGLLRAEGSPKKGQP